VTPAALTPMVRRSRGLSSLLGVRNEEMKVSGVIDCLPEPIRMTTHLGQQLGQGLYRLSHATLIAIGYTQYVAFLL